jgi:phosphoribosyl-ATP pyrophosphohydrolase
MKPGLLLTLAFSLFIASCSNKEKTVTTVAADGTITETALPRGRFIVDDATTVSNIPQDPTTLNGINGQNDNPAKDPVKEKAADLKRRYKNLLVFHADDTMKVNKSYIATLILGKDQILADVKEEVLETSSTGKKNVKEDTTIEIGNTMKAVLKSMEDGIDKSFEIERLGDEDAAEKKITDKRKKLMWQWKIKPLTRGQQNLVLTISIREKDGEKVDLPVRKIDVLIFAEPESIISKVGTFFEKNFQWMLATLLIPLFMGWYNARMRHKFDRRMAQERELRERQQATTYQQPQQPVTDTPKTNETTST